MAEELQEKMKSILYFIVKMFAFSIPLYVILWTNWESVIYQNFIVQQVKGILGMMGFTLYRSGNQLTVNNIPFLISWDCTGWKSLMFLTALIISTPSKLKKKITGLSVGLYALFVVNILRIVILINLAILYGAGFFNFVHDIFWQIFGGLAVLVIWILWMYIENVLIYPSN